MVEEDENSESHDMLELVSSNIFEKIGWSKDRSSLLFSTFL